MLHVVTPVIFTTTVNVIAKVFIKDYATCHINFVYIQQQTISLYTLKEKQF